MTVKATKRKLTELIPDARNANTGTVRGLAMLEDSLRKHGLGRGILLDRNNQIVAGNKTVERAVDQGFENVIIVPTDGKTLVATQRVDLDLDSPEGRELALLDNRVSEVDLSWNPAELAALADDGVDLAALWDADELAALLATVGANGEPEPAGVDSIPEQWSILIECKTEQEQAELLERLSGEGIKCHALIS